MDFTGNETFLLEHELIHCFRSLELIRKWSTCHSQSMPNKAACCERFQFRDMEVDDIVYLSQSKLHPTQRSVNLLDSIQEAAKSYGGRTDSSWTTEDFNHDSDCEDEEPFGQLKLSQMRDEVETYQTESSRIFQVWPIYSIREISLRKIYQFKRCLIYDDGNNQSEVCAVCCMNKVLSPLSLSLSLPLSLSLLGTECLSRRATSLINFSPRFSSLGHCIKF